ncbi:MAG: hypothetical protein JNK60_06740 [Acidobacteria bacterium]|nr:hypothetical protein [Acidobacteriota bacterium]
MADPDDVDGGAGPEKMLRILWIVAGLLALGIGIAYVSGGNRAVEKTVGSVAVLPLSGEGSLPLAFAETLSRSLKAAPGLAVPAFEIARARRGEEPRAAGRALAVDAVVTGRLTVTGEVLEVVLDLLRVADGAVLLHAVERKPLAEALALHTEVAHQLGQRLRGKGSARLEPAAKDAEAFLSYLKGNAGESPNDVALLRKAAEREPAFALAQAALARALVRGAVPSAADLDGAKAAAERALALDPSLVEAQAALALVRAERDPDPASALSSLPPAHPARALALGILGRFDEARAVLDAAAKADPDSLAVARARALVSYWAGENDAVLAAAAKVAGVDPAFAELLTGLALQAKGRTAGDPAAVDALGRAVDASARGPFEVASLAHALAGAGKKADAKKLVGELLDRAKTTNDVPPAALALAHWGAGDRAKALSALEKAADGREGLRRMLIDPRFAKLRGERRFAAVAAKPLTGS